MGTNWPNAEFKCHIKGNLLLTNYPETPGVEMRMKIEQINIDQKGIATFGASTGKLLIWVDWIGYNAVYGERFYNMSDSTTKENITPLNLSLNTIKKFNSYSYNYKKKEKDSLKHERKSNEFKGDKSFGFLAQEVELFLPEIIDTAMGLKMIDYTAIIPILTEAIKEQQVQIETLQSIVNSQEQDLIDFKKEFKNCCLTKDNNKSKFKNAELGNPTLLIEDIKTVNAVLYNNTPNPFSIDTKISFEIPDNSNSAKLIIYDVQGIELKSFDISQKGYSYITINGSELKAGLYLYTLLVDNEVVDTKRMLLTKD